MGSSIGNFNRNEASEFLRNFTSILDQGDIMLIGIDSCQEPEKVYHAYNDVKGKTHEFVLNGLVHANRLLGKNAFNLADWKVIGEYDIDAGRHHAFVAPSKDVEVEGINIEAGEKIRIEESYKYSSEQCASLWQAAGLVPGAKYGSPAHSYSELPSLLATYVRIIHEALLRL